MCIRDRAVGQLALHTLFGLGQQRADAAAHRKGSEGHLINFAGQLVCDQPRPLSTAEARRVITDAGLDPAVHPAAAAPGGGGAAAQAAHGPLAHVLTPSLPMLLGHLLAALALGWLLRRGEAALWRVVRLSAESARGVAEAALVRSLRAALVLVGAQATPAGPTAVVPLRRAADDERPAREPELQHSVVRRGPPRFALAA